MFWAKTNHYLAVSCALLCVTCSKGPDAEEPSRCTPDWVRSWGAEGDDRTESVGVDSAGNIYTAGWFQGTVDFGLGEVRSQGDRDAYLVRRGEDGRATWVQNFGGPGKDVVWGLAVAPSGNVAVAAVYHDAIELAQGVLLPATSDGYDGVVAEYAPDGRLLWHVTLHSPGEAHLFGIHVNPKEEVVVTGSFDESLTVGGETLVSEGQRDGLVVKISPQGNVRWTHRFGGKGPDFGYGITSGPRGRVIVAGSVQSTVDFGGGPTAGGNDNDAVLVTYDADGELLWTRRFGDNKSQEAMSVAIAPDHGIAVGGQFSGSFDLGGEHLVAKGDKPDGFVALLDDAGNVRWAKSVGSPGVADAIRSVAVDGGGNVVATGSFQGKTMFDGQLLTSGGRGDALVMKISASGQRQWACGWGGPGSEIGYWIATDRQDNVIVAGAFQATTAAAPTAKELETAQNNGFLMKIAPCGCSKISHGEAH